MPHNIIEALGLQSLPASEQEVIVKKALADNYVQLCSQNVMIEHFAAEAISRMPAVAFAALHRRINPTPEPAPVYLVGWRVQGGLMSGKALLLGSCSRCGQTCHFDGKPDAAKNIVWTHCTLGPSKPTEDAIAEYRSRFGTRM